MFPFCGGGEKVKTEKETKLGEYERTKSGQTQNKGQLSEGKVSCNVEPWAMAEA